MDELDVDSFNDARPRSASVGRSRNGSRALIYRNQWWRLAGDGTVFVRDPGGAESPMPLADAPLPVTRAFGTMALNEV